MQYNLLSVEILMYGHLETCFQLEIIISLYSKHDNTWVNGDNIYIYSLFYTRFT